MALQTDIAASPPPRVQRKNPESCLQNEVWVGIGSVFAGPFVAPEMTEQLKARRFRDWLVAGPESKSWLDSDIEHWTTLVLSLPILAGKTLASHHPVDLPCFVDVLVELRPQPGQRSIISWANGPA